MWIWHDLTASGCMETCPVMADLLGQQPFEDWTFNLKALRQRTKMDGKMATFLVDADGWGMSILRSSPYRTLCVSCLLFVCGNLVISSNLELRTKGLCIQLHYRSQQFGSEWFIRKYKKMTAVIHEASVEMMSDGCIKLRAWKCLECGRKRKTMAAENYPSRPVLLQSTVARWGVPSIGFGRLCRGLLARPLVENGGKKTSESMYECIEPILNTIIHEMAASQNIKPRSIPWTHRPIHTPRSIPKRRWSRPIHTSGSPRADPYPNFDATPNIIKYQNRYHSVEYDVIWCCMMFHDVIWVILFPESVWAKGSSNEVCHHIFSSSHLLIFMTSSLLHLHIFLSYHLHIFLSSHLLIFSSSHLLIFTSSYLLIFTPSYLHIFLSSHLHIFSSSHLVIFTSSHLLSFTSCPFALLFSCSFALFSFLSISLLRRGAVPTRRHEMQPFRTKWGSIVKNWGKIATFKRPAQPFRTKWGSIVKKWGKTFKRPAQPFSHEMRFDRQKLR